MDDTQQSRVSDAASTATRKRRSSILKSQRPARTPFSELEFNVATPTDTAKSRRVSFSRRTGVAEFVTNEATTTWKNFYEEHNKSLESSSNDSQANASQQPVGHLGKRIFDQQFEEVEAVDFISDLANRSMNNVNFTQQLASLEFAEEDKLTAPHNKFELSAFTEQSKLFGNNLTAPSIGENSGRIDVNFSAIQQVEKDDLDEIEKDLERGSNNMGCHGPFGGRENMSEYIEVDLNMTHAVKNDEDMSLTDTSYSPIPDVSISVSIDNVSLNNDWAADKENIAINPYAAPCESNFAVNEEPDQVLVFDGKRLILQPDKPEKDKNYRQTLLPNSSAETPQRKTIVLNVNDDLPNFIDSSGISSGFQDIKSTENEISDTVPVNCVNNKSKRNTIQDNTGNIYMTQALPTNIICPAVAISQDVNPIKRRTIVFNESTSNISVTEAVAVKLLDERHRTVVYEDNTGNISITQAVPSNILENEKAEGKMKHKTIVFDDEGDISITQALQSNIILEDIAGKIKTTVYDDDACNVSFSQVLPSKQTQEKRRTIIYENDTGNISVTQALPTNVILPNYEHNSERRRTVVYEDDSGNISVTQALPLNILQESIQLDDKNENNAADNDATNITAKDSHASRRRTIVYENDTGNISITQAIPTQLIPGYSEDKSIGACNTSIKPRNKKRTTIVYDNDEGQISMTEAISANIIEEATNERKTIVYDEEETNISTILAISTNVFLLDNIDSAEDLTAKKPEEIKDKVIHNVYESDILEDDRTFTDCNADNCDPDMSMTMAIQKVQILRELEKRKTGVFDNDKCDISMTKPIPADLITFETELLHKFKSKLFDLTEQDQIANSQPDVIVLQASVTSSKPTLHSSSTEQRDLTKDKLSHRSITSDSKVKSQININDDVFGSPVESVTANDSLLHPAVEEKTHQINLITSGTEINENKVDGDGDDDAMTQTDTNENKELTQTDSKEDKESTDTKEEKESLLNSLLSKSDSTINSSTEDKNLMACVESNVSTTNDIDYKTSTESMFYITTDNEGDTQVDKEVDNEKTKSKKPKENLPIPKFEQRETELEEIDEVQIKLAELQTAVSQNNDLTNRLPEKIESSNLEDVVERDENVEYTLHNYNADSTQKLLEMISNFTDSRDSDDDDVEPIVVKVKSEDITEHKRLSVASNRQSIALTREDLLNNISMAQAALQKSRLALDDSESLEEDTRDATTDLTQESDRTNNEVVKTLQFDDETISETSLLSDSRLSEAYSPLKKTAFGETSYMNENKANVIPTYLKNVSDGIKELMLDLVKPTSDNLPFDGGLIDKGVMKNTSTHSTQVQANMTTSSQVDVAFPPTYADVDKKSPLSARSPDRLTFVRSENLSKFDPEQGHLSSEAPVEQPAPPEVLVFDHLNPLNNIFLAPLNYTGAHKYNPMKSDETLCGPERNRSIGTSFDTMNVRDYEHEIKLVTTMVYPMSPPLNTMQEDVCVQKDYQLDTQPILSDRSLSGRLLSTDESIDTVSTELKDDEVNTMIAMKGNKELLAASSSLTLVDEAIEGEGRSWSPAKVCTNHRIKFSISPPVNEMEKVMKLNNMALFSESDISLQDLITCSHSNVSTTKGKKRIYSPSTEMCKHCRPSVEGISKPIKKMQKISNSPKAQRSLDLSLTNRAVSSMAPEKDVSKTYGHMVYQNAHTSKICETMSKKKQTKAGQKITVQQLITEYHVVDSDFKHKNNHSENMFWDKLNVHPKSGTSTVFSQSDDSFTEEFHSASTMDCQASRQLTMQDRPSQEWKPELLHATSSNRCGPDSGVNVVAKIDMLPFMGSHECEWETSAADTWSFRLLHGRLRLTARLGHRHDNAMRTRVRGDTPVLDIVVDTVQHDRKNPVATMCVRFACETMRYLVSHTLRTKCCAGDVPPLLRRCAAVARIALRWGRAMHDAKLHLAYTVENNGNLSLKVANIPLRSVWEVTMRIELVVDDNQSTPWPRASRVCVARVVSDVLVPDDEVRRALLHTPRDWGHAPRTIWRIFRYLKNKTREDYLVS